jgi:hypothetical protein
MLAAAFTSYVGAFGASFRYKLWSEIWLKVCPPDVLRSTFIVTFSFSNIASGFDESGCAYH